jgi:hypothetical protein
MAEEQPISESVSYSNQEGIVQVDLVSSLYGVNNTEENRTITISKEGYQDLTFSPYDKNGTLRDTFLIELVSNETFLDEEVRKTTKLTDEQVDEILSSKKDAQYFSQKRLSGISKQLKQRIIPIILTQIIVKFGVTNPLDLIKQIKTLKSQGVEEQQIIDLIKSKTSTCPSSGTISKIVKIKNNLTPQLNNVMTVLNTTTKVLGVTGGIIKAFESIFQILKYSPIPIPSFAPVSLVGLIEDAKKFADEDIIKKLGAITTATLAVLLVIRQVLVQILDLLDLLDKLIMNCVNEKDEEDFNNFPNVNPLSSELLSLQDQQAQFDNQIPKSEVNGFKIEIETESPKKSSSIKRKRAIAIDPSGVAVLKGEWSLSSISQILIDELIFYIQSNNLKAD